MDNNQNQRNNNPLGSGSNSPRRQNIILLLVAALVTMVCMSYFLRAFSDNTNKEITYSEFITMVDDGKVEKIVIDYDKIDIYPKETKEEDKLGAGYAYWTGNSTVTYYTGKAEEDSVLTDRMLKAGVEVSSKVPDNSGIILTVILQYIVPALLMWLIISFIFRRMGRGGGPLSVGKSNAKVYVQKETGVTFKDVAGEDEAKESLVEVVDFLHNPAKYVKIGAKLPKLLRQMSPCLHHPPSIWHAHQKIAQNYHQQEPHSTIHDHISPKLYKEDIHPSSQRLLS